MFRGKDPLEVKINGSIINKMSKSTSAECIRAMSAFSTTDEWIVYTGSYSFACRISGRRHRCSVAYWWFLNRPWKSKAACGPTIILWQKLKNTHVFKHWETSAWLKFIYNTQTMFFSFFTPTLFPQPEMTTSFLYSGCLPSRSEVSSSTMFQEVLKDHCI